MLAQELTLLKRDIAWLKLQLLRPIDRAIQQSLCDKLAAMTELTDGTIGSVQRIAMQLRPIVLDSLGLGAAIEWQTREFQARTGIKCTARVPEGDLRLARDCATALFRILQESLTNVARHAHATRVEIELQRQTTSLNLTVRDNGCGIRDSDLCNSQSIGLVGMRERATLLGGHCNITRTPEGGTAVETCVPFRPKETTDATNDHESPVSRRTCLAA